MSTAEDQLRLKLEKAIKEVLELEQKLGAANSLADSQGLFKVTVDQTHEGIQIIDSSWTYLYVNQAAAQHGQREKNELIGNKMTDLYPGIDNTDFFKVLISVMDTRVPRQMENQFEFPVGRKNWFELFIEPHPLGVLIRSIDITKRKKFEEQYQHAQKMEAVGLLAGGIAHDFNNKLGIMTLFCEMAIDQLEENQMDKVKTSVQKVLKAVGDSTMLTKQLLAFGRKQVLDLKVVSFNDIITNTKEALQTVLGENIKLHCHLDPTVGLVRADLSQMDQVVLNLCINARDAIGGKGNITIETSNIELDSSYCQIHPQVIPGSYVLLSISDDGCGMSPEVRQRIFEPFFTTKEFDKGTGLGLPSVHGIVNQSRGHIWVYSEKEIGTTFKIYFPRVQEAKDVIGKNDVLDKVAGGSETILLVEDDTLLKVAFEQTLSKAGYKVVTVPEPIQAIDIFKQRKSEISLLLTDVIMPKISGKDLAKSLSEIKPDLKVIYVSGYTENSIVHYGILDTESVLLQKPVPTRKLLHTIRQVLDNKITKGVI